MFIQRIIHSKFGRYAIAVILGLGIASIFRPACSGDNCYEFVGAPSTEVGQKTYRYNGECYRFQPQATTCSKHVQTLAFSSAERKTAETETQPKSLLTKLMSLGDQQ
jgi:hypothetical protein